VSQSGLVESDWSVTQNMPAGRPADKRSDGTLIREFNFHFHVRYKFRSLQLYPTAQVVLYTTYDVGVG